MFVSTNVHGAKNEWTFLLSTGELHLVNADTKLKPFSWFAKAYNYNTKCNASFFTYNGAVGPFITDLKIKRSNVYGWWWIGWNCDTVYVSNKTVTLNDKSKLNYLVSGTPLLLRDGKPVSKKEMLESCSRGFFNRKCPRTAIGILGNIIVIYITTSATIPELQNKMQSLGCSYAINLDGGGSTFIDSPTVRFPKKIKRNYPNLLAW